MHFRDMMYSLRWLLLLVACGCTAPTEAPTQSTSVSKGSDEDREGTRVESRLDTESTQAAIRSWHALQDKQSKLHPDVDNTLHSIEVFLIPDAPELCLAICDYQPQWWGFFGLYQVQAGQVTWQAHCEEPPTEQSICSLQGLKLSGFDHSVIEVYGQTHMGHGCLYLYELQDRNLMLRLVTRAVDNHNNGEIFRDGRLRAEYSDLNGDGVTDISLSGDIDQFDEKGDQVVKTFPCRKAFVWNPSSEKFEEDTTRRVGFPKDVD